MRLVGEAYWWWKDSHIECRDWFVLQDLLLTRYNQYLERPQFSDLVAEYKEILVGMGKILESMTVKDPEPRVKSCWWARVKVRARSCCWISVTVRKISSQLTEIEKLPTETLVDLLTEPTMELVSSLEAMRDSLFLRSPDEYDPLQIFLTVSQEVGILICGLNFSGAELTC